MKTFRHLFTKCLIKTIVGMKKEWSIDWDLLFSNFTSFRHYNQEASNSLCLLFGRASSIILPLFTVECDNERVKYIRSCLSADIDVVGVLRVGEDASTYSPPKGTFQAGVAFELLLNKDKAGLQHAVPFLVDSPDIGKAPPRIVVATVNFEFVIRDDRRESELVNAYNRQLPVMDTLVFMTPDRQMLSGKASDKDPVQLPNRPGLVRLRGMQCLTAPSGEEESLVPVARVAHGRLLVPVARVAHGSSRCLLERIALEACAPVFPDDTPRSLHARLVESSKRQLYAAFRVHHSLVLERNASLASTSCVFLPAGWTRHLHLVVPDSFHDEDRAREYRRRQHAIFNLSPYTPCVRLGQSLLATTPGLLRDLHSYILNYRPVGEVELVGSGYDYYHYTQQGMDDSGWGCAYRSLQTISSWFITNGLVEGTVPTHKEIQQCLVSIGDKEPSFVGSKKWIGSTELGFVLESRFNLSYKIMTTNSGIEVAERAREILYHFKRNRSPVMIGGGQLAHTILGVDMNVDSGEVRFLVLDPHYTGRDEVELALKGGCEWKKASFWSADSFYNLLLPQVPINVI